MHWVSFIGPESIFVAPAILRNLLRPPDVKRLVWTILQLSSAERFRYRMGDFPYAGGNLITERETKMHNPGLNAKDDD